MKLIKWAVFVSGTGSNLQALLDLVGDLKPSLILSNQANAPALGKARRMGISTRLLSQPLDWKAVDLELKSCGIQKIFLLGFMKILPESFINEWTQKIFNLHPSLLPSYPGLHAFEKAYQDRNPLGVTVHHVVAQVDAGPMLIQQSFRNSENLQECRLQLSWTEQRLVREVFLNESF